MTARRTTVLAIADSDSYLKWACATLDRLDERFTTRVVLLASPITPSAGQVEAATSATRFASAAPPVLRLRELRTLLRQHTPDVLLLAATGPIVELVVELASRVERRPALVSGIPGMALPANERALQFRSRCDAIAAHSHREVREVRALVEALGLGARVLLSRLPFLPAAPLPQPTEPTAVVFTTQAKVPATPRQRERILRALAALAADRPDLDVVVKVRALRGERQTHNELHPYAALWDELVATGQVAPDGVRFAAGPLADFLGPGNAHVTVSSTAALEAIAAGLPILVLDEFGLNESQLNAVFIGSGCTGGLADLVAARFRPVDPAWASDNYLHTEPSELPDALLGLAAARAAGPLPVRERMALPRFRRRVARTAARSAAPAPALRIWARARALLRR